VKTLQSWLFFTLLCLISVMATFWLRGGTDANVLATLDSMATDFQYWLAGQGESTGADSAVRDQVRENKAGALFLPSSTGQRTSAPDHTSGDSAVCGRPPTKSRTDTSSQVIYKWVDEDGQTHMSDKHPEGRITSIVDLGKSKQDFTYEIVPVGVSLPIDFQGQLAAGSKRMYDTWHFFLGEENLRQSKIQLLLLGDPDRFDAYYANGSTLPGSAKIAGFYRINENQAVVKYNAKRPVQNLRTTFHEISHLITASHLGPTPPWLTEGLAEYFETMQVAGQGGAIHPNHGHIKLLRTIPLPSLGNYLAIDGSDWYEKNRDRNYAIAWSLVNFLMSGAPGKYALRETVQQSHENFCKPFSAAAALSKAYPGGIRQLEADWRKWLASGDFQVQQT
jgi:Domain of unknown function (DUF4124)/Protein of unknown function (DUF1570)